MITTMPSQLVIGKLDPWEATIEHSTNYREAMSSSEASREQSVVTIMAKSSILNPLTKFENHMSYSSSQ